MEAMGKSIILPLRLKNLLFPHTATVFYFVSLLSGALVYSGLLTFKAQSLFMMSNSRGNYLSTSHF